MTAFVATPLSPRTMRRAVARTSGRSTSPATNRLPHSCAKQGATSFTPCTTESKEISDRNHCLRTARLPSLRCHSTDAEDEGIALHLSEPGCGPGQGGRVQGGWLPRSPGGRGSPGCQGRGDLERVPTRPHQALVHP